MKKIIVLWCVLLMLPVAAIANTFNVIFVSDDPNFDGEAVLLYTVCKGPFDLSKPCNVQQYITHMFYASTGVNKTQVTVDDDNYVIGYQMGTTRTTYYGPKSKTDSTQLCKAVNDGDTLDFSPQQTNGPYYCNGEEN